MTLPAEQYEALPAQMREARRWLLWKLIPNPDTSKKPRKVPFYVSGRPRHGDLDTPGDLAALATFDDACAALARGGYAGLGFAMGPDGTGNYWQGVDLDELASHPELQILVDDGLPGYTEASPSGTGVHAIGYGRAFPPMGSNTSGIEAYSGGRYFTVTADDAGIGEPVDLADYIEQTLRPMHSRSAAPVSAQVLEYVDPRTIAELRSALAAMRADDRDTWIANGQRLKKLGERGRALWLEWSQTSDKYDPADAARVWDSFSADHTGYQAVFKAAQAAGWLNPMSNAAPPPTPVEPTPELQATVRAALTPLTPADIEAAAIPHPHAFQDPAGERGLFPEGEVTVIGAPGREGKTTLMIALATNYALGWPLGGMAPTEVRSVLIYSAEDDRAQYARKAGAQWTRLSADNQRRLLDNLIIPDLHTPEMAAWREIVRLENRQPVRGVIVETLIAETAKLMERECPPGLAIFETASTLSDAEEDNPGHKALIAALKHFAKSTGLAVILVHHTSQAAANNLPTLHISEADIRGGTTLVNNSRQTHLVVNLGSVADPFPEADARTLLRGLVAPGESDRVTALVCLSSSKSADPTPLFFRWESVPPYGPRMVEITPPEHVAGRPWRAVRGLINGARVEAAADKKAAQGRLHATACVESVRRLAEAGKHPTVTAVSADCGRSPTWAKPYLQMAVELGDLVVTPEKVPRSIRLVDVYRIPSNSPKPWENDSTPPWSQNVESEENE